MIVVGIVGSSPRLWFVSHNCGVKIILGLFVLCLLVACVVCLFVCLLACLFACLLACLFVCLCVFLFAVFCIVLTGRAQQLVVQRDSV